MNDLEFLKLAELLLATIEANCDRINEESDADIDNQRVGNMVTLTFANGSQIVINLQKPLSEIWMATKSGGYHYRHIQGKWTDTKTSNDFYADLSRSASLQSGQSLVFAPASF